MPFKDPAAHAAYMREWRRSHPGYYPAYEEQYAARPDPDTGTKAEHIRRRKAKWFQRNKKRLTAAKAKARRSAAIGDRITLAIGVLRS